MVGFQKGRMSSGHRLRDVEQQRPLLDGEEETAAEAEKSFHGEAKRLWFIQDCCGMVCAFITWFLVLYADFVVTFVMLLPSRSFWYAVVNGVFFNSLAGAVPKGNATKKYLESLQLKPGEMYIAMISCHALALCGYQFITCIKVQWRECSDFSPPVTMMLMIFLCMEALLFFTFTAEIERLKNEKPTWERQTRWAGLRLVFGGPPSLLWISPFAGLKLPTLLPRRSWKGGAEFSV
ncbi:hypothetical protein FQN60_014360 [Etheostoma spectabile]|uniref:Uncharacterized protein n=1 Tax=Etheostoma spectabile TaxID=54343 RepID=A0A5J5DC98_9PERO|nr:hypothetical protein FQN60_014360 [Etheostoma spectabile]